MATTFPCMHLTWIEDSRGSVRRGGSAAHTDGQVALEGDAVLLRVLAHAAQLAVQVPLQPVRELDAAVVRLLRAAQPLQHLHRR